MAGRPLIAHTLSRVAAAPSIARVIVVCPGARRADVLRLGAEVGVTELSCVPGGPRRRDSVAAGLAAAGDAEIVVVHDAARPLASHRLIEALIAAARREGAATAAIPCVYTIKRVAGGRVVETLPREQLVAVQTPQAFDADLLRRAHAAEPELDASDDCLLVERLGVPVAVVPGEPSNRKITLSDDVEWLRRQMRAEERA